MNSLSLLLPCLLLLNVCNGEGEPPRGTRRGVRRLVRRPGAGAGDGTGRVKRRKKVGWRKTKLIFTPPKEIGGQNLILTTDHNKPNFPNSTPGWSKETSRDSSSGRKGGNCRDPLPQPFQLVQRGRPSTVLSLPSTSSLLQMPSQ